MSVFCAIDFETSGRESYTACSVGMVRIVNGQLGDTFVRLIRPPSSRVYFTHVHGLTWRDLRDKPGFREIWPEMAAFMQGAVGLVAHNAPFDRSVFLGCCEAFGLPHPAIPFFCTLKGARKAIRLPSYRLDAVCRHFGLPLNHHEALSDALGCAGIFVRLVEMGLAPEIMRLNPPKPRPRPLLS